MTFLTCTLERERGILAHEKSLDRFFSEMEQSWNHGTQLQLGLKKHGKQIYLGPKHAFLKRKKK